MWGIHQSKENYPIGNPLANATSAAEILAHPFPDPDALDYEHYAARCEQFEDYAVCGGDWSPFFTMALEMMGTEQFLVAMRTMPEVAHAVLQRTADYYYETTRRMFEAARAAGWLVSARHLLHGRRLRHAARPVRQPPRL